MDKLIGAVIIGVRGRVNDRWRLIEEVGSDGLIKLVDGGYVLSSQISSYQYVVREPIKEWTKL